jgi:branched-subunit amino acid ABC-type transport system permease component
MELLSSLDWITNPVVVARQFMAGLANDMMLFLVAAGLSLIFGVSRIINFAHGGFFMLGAYIAFTVGGALSNSIPGFVGAVI